MAKVRLEIHKTFIDGFVSVSFTSSIKEVASGFSIELMYNDNTKWIKPFHYQRVRLYLDDELLITGRIEKISLSQDLKMQIQGRSLPASFVECSVQPPYQFHNVSLAVVAKELTNPFDIGVVNWVKDLNQYDRLTAEAESTVFDFLNNIAEKEGVFLASYPDGALWLRRYEDRRVHGTFKLVEGTYWGASASFDGSKRFSTLTLLTQQDKGKALSFKIDGRLNTYRPMTAVVEAKDEGTLQQMANKRLALNVSESVKVEFSIFGWPRSTQEDRLLRIGDVVRVEDESIGLRSGIWIIEGLSLMLGSSDFSCKVSLALPEMYGTTPQLGATPW